MFNPQMKAQAAQMAAQRLDEDDQMPPKAPIVPATNMRAPRPQVPQAPRPQPQAQPQMQQQQAPRSQLVQPSLGQSPTLNPTHVQIPDRAIDKLPRQPTGVQGPDRIIAVPPRPPTTTQGEPDIIYDAPPTGGVQGEPDIITDAPPRPMTEDELFQERMRDLMGQGPRNTAEEERILREQMLRDVGANQAGLNARMAAGGGSASGALGAMTTDMRSRAALDAAKGMETIRENARGEWLDRVKAGMGGYFDDRSADIDENRNNMLQDMIRRMYPEGGGDKTSPVKEAPYQDWPDTETVPVKESDGSDGLPEGSYMLSDGYWKAPDGSIWSPDKKTKVRG